MPGTFRLAALSESDNPLYWQTINQLISQANIPADPDASYIPQAEVVKSLSGLTFPRGFASAVWHWDVLTNTQRAILREFCPSSSAYVYIETKTNEVDMYGDYEFIQCLAIMHWPISDEQQEAGKTIGLDLVFDHLIEVS